MSQEGESLVSQDADPLPPRGQPNERGASDQSAPPEVPEPQETAEETPVPVPMPHPNWRFNSFLVELADEIDGDELDKLKALFLDEIGRNVLERLTTARDLFDQLRKRLLISWDNMVCLQSMLMKLKRPELVQMAVEYARDTGDIIYFYPESESVSGRKNIKVHVEGKDFKNCTRRYLRELQSTFSCWLCIPPEHVLIAGVQPSSSMLITLMIPDMYADVLETLLTRTDAMQPFSELGIDTIQIGEKIFNINGIEEADIVETEQQTKLISVYQQVQDKKKQLDNMSLEVLKLQDEQNDMLKKLDDVQIENDTLRQLFYTSQDEIGKRPASLSSQVAFAQFKESLQEIKENNYDRTIIQKLLRANTSVMHTRSRDMHVIKLQQMNLQLQQMKVHLQEMQSQFVPLQFEVFFHRTNGAGSLETLLRDSLVRLFETIQVPQQKQEHALTVYGNEILKKISRSLRYREKQKLEKKYKWKPNDHLTKCKDDDQSLFLSCLFFKEIERTQGYVDCVQFIDDCLKEVKRPDLQRKFQEMASAPPPQPGAKRRSRSASGQHPSGEAAPMQPIEEQLSKLERMMQTTVEKVTGIENTITSAMNYSQPFDQPFGAKLFPTGKFDFPYQHSDENRACD